MTNAILGGLGLLGAAAAAAAWLVSGRRARRAGHAAAHARTRHYRGGHR